MLNALIAINDQIKINTLSTVLRNDGDVNYVFFSDSMKAIEYVTKSNVSVDLAVISAGMSILDGEELAEVIAGENYRCRFIFIFDDMTIENAVRVFNQYDYCGLMYLSAVEAEDIRYLVSNLKDEISSEVNYKSDLQAFRESEKENRIALSDMSSILNARVSCYDKIISLYSKSVQLILEQYSDIDYESSVNKILMQIREYVNIFLGRNTDANELFDAICVHYHIPDDKKYLSFERCEDIIDNDVMCYMAFITQFVCMTYLDYLSVYKAKFTQSVDKNYFKIDLIMDTRAGYPNKKEISFLKRITECLADGISDKFEKAIKNGIVHYRICFDKSRDYSGAVLQ